MSDGPIEVGGVNASDDLSPFGDHFGSDVDVPRRRRTVVARSERGAIGVASALWSRRHPDYGFAEIAVAVGWRRNGVASRLLDALERAAAGPLLFNVNPEASGIVPFLEARGYRRIVESRTVRIQTAPTLRLLRSALRDIPGVVVAPASLNEEIEGLYEDVYAERHRWAGTYQPTPGQPWIASAGNLIHGTLFAARQSGRPIAAMGVHAGPFGEGADGFIAPTGVCAMAQSGSATDVIRALLVLTLAAAQDAGLVALNVEYDTPYVELADVLSGAPVEVVSSRACLIRL